MANIPQPLVDLLNKTDPGYIPYAFMVPTRIIRVIATLNFCTFRVEQLVRTNKDPYNPQGGWRTLSTHGGTVPGEMLNTAMHAARDAQTSLRNKLAKRHNSKVKLLKP